MIFLGSQVTSVLTGVMLVIYLVRNPVVIVRLACLLTDHEQFRLILARKYYYSTLSSSSFAFSSVVLPRLPLPFPSMLLPCFFHSIPTCKQLTHFTPLPILPFQLVTAFFHPFFQASYFSSSPIHKRRETLVCTNKRRNCSIPFPVLLVPVRSTNSFLHFTLSSFSSAINPFDL